MSDALTVLNILYDVSKDLYRYYQAWKDCDQDVAELRQQLLWLCTSFQTIERELQQPALAADVRAQVEQALVNCRESAGELQATLDAITTKEPPRTALQKLQAHGRKAIYPFRKSTVQGLAENVESCRETLQFAIGLVSLNLNTVAHNDLLSLDTKIINGVERIENAIQQLQIEGKKAQLSINGHQDRVDSMLQAEKDDKKATRIIESLWFEGMDARRRMITNASEATCDWVFEEHTGPSRYNAKILRQSAKLLTDWLKNDDGIFWLSGKPGSGKSTFMKFLSEHSGTEDLLEDRTDDSVACGVAHFFSVSGLPMQRTQEGMLQSLLFFIFRNEPSLVSVACSRRWKRDKADSWSLKELWDSLFAAVQASRYQICLFIDGLDECQPDKDQAGLSSQLTKLSEISNAKVMVSSRPWTVFQRAFGQSSNQLTLEEVNRKDIFHLIRNRVTEAACSESMIDVDWDMLEQKLLAVDDRSMHRDRPAPSDDLEDLVELIIRKAEGVFLWVSLVLDGLCERLAHGDHRASLHEHVNDFPKELEDYFRKLIYDRIPETFRLSETAMALQVQMQFQYHDRGASPMDFFVLMQGLRGPQKFILRPDFVSETSFEAYKNIDTDDMVRQSQDFVKSRCKDLVKLNKTTDGENASHSVHDCFEFIHRTVVDFLQTSEMQHLIRSHIPEHFNDRYFASRVNLAGVRASGCHFTWVEARLRRSLLTSEQHARHLLEMPDDLLNQHEETAIYYQHLWQPGRERHHWTLYAALCTTFLYRGRLAYARRLVEREPAALCCGGENFWPTSSDAVCAAFGVWSPETDHLRNGVSNEVEISVLEPTSMTTQTVEWVLNHHADPNLNPPALRTSFRGSGNATPWKAFLARLELYEKLSDLVEASQSEAVSNDGDSDVKPYVISVVHTSLRRLFNEIEIQKMLKLLIQHGADLSAEVQVWKVGLNEKNQPVLWMSATDEVVKDTLIAADIIRKRLSSEFIDEWNLLLEEYLAPETLSQLRYSRRMLVKEWPPQLLSKNDRSLLGLQSNTCTAARTRRLEREETTLTDVDDDDDPSFVHGGLNPEPITDLYRDIDWDQRRRNSISLPLPRPQRTPQKGRGRWMKDEFALEHVEGLGLSRLKFRTREQRQEWKSRGLHQKSNFNFKFSQPLPFLQERKTYVEAPNWDDMKLAFDYHFD